MPSRQDQLHSYQFMVQRVVAALVLRETDPAQSPFRRAAGTALASMLVAAILFGGMMVYGVFAGGGTSGWRNEKAVLIEKESGTRYVFLNGQLHPVVNYASALMIVGSQKTMLVSRASLAGVSRGAPLGIPDAPDSLPAVKQLAATPWAVCSLPPSGNDQPTARSTLLVGQAPSGGRALGDDAVLGQHPNGSIFLIWHNRRHRVQENLVLAALTWGSQPRVVLAPAVLNSLPAGDDLKKLPVAGVGGPSLKVPNAKIGEVFVVNSQGGGRQYAVALRDGLAGVTEVQANILLTQGVGQKEPTQMTQAMYAALPLLPDLVPASETAPPATLPKLVEVGEALCTSIADDSGVREVRIGVRAPDVSGAARTATKPGDPATFADYVLVPPGRGVVVEAASAPGATGGAVSVVTDLGLRYQVSDPGVLQMLGYQSVKPLRLPAGVVTLVPAGTALDPQAARLPAAPA